MEYSEGQPGGFDPHKRIPDMDMRRDRRGIPLSDARPVERRDHDPELAAACCRAYNRWLADYCKPYPDRLFGVAMLPLQSIELAIEEMKFARKELGFRAGFLRPNPYNNRLIHDPVYEPFWNAAEDLDFAIGFHEGASAGMPQVGIDRFETRGAQHIITHTMEMMLAALSMIWGGVCERHPKLRVAFLESGGGWIAPWLDRMDRHFDDQGFNDSGLKTRPSEIFQQQLLDFVRAGRGQPQRARRLCRPAQDHVGDRLSAPGRVLPRRAEDGAGQDRGAVARDQAPGDGRRGDGVLRPQLTD